MNKHITLIIGTALCLAIDLVSLISYPHWFTVICTLLALSCLATTVISYVIKLKEDK